MAHTAETVFLDLKNVRDYLLAASRQEIAVLEDRLHASEVYVQINVLDPEMFKDGRISAVAMTVRPLDRAAANESTT